MNRYYVVYDPNEAHPLDTILCTIELRNPYQAWQGNKRISDKYVQGFLVKKHSEPSRLLKKKRKNK